MRKFSYKKTLDTQSIILSKQKKKINKQQIIFSIFFFVLLISAVAYWTYKSYIKTLNGYLISRYDDVTLIDDAFIVKMYVKQGQTVPAGDTLFSYILTNFLFEANNPNAITDLQAESRKLSTSVAALKSEIAMLNKDRASLYSYIKTTKQNIRLGISTKDDLKKLELSLTEVENKLANAKRLLSLNLRHQGETQKMINKTSNKNLPVIYTQNFLTHNEKIYGNLLQYRIALNDIYIVDLKSYSSRLVYKKDAVMTVFAYSDPIITDLHIEALIPPDFLTEMKDSDKVDIFLGNEKLGLGTISLRGSYLDVVKPFKLSGFSQNNEAVFVRVNIDDIKTIPLKYQINNLPIHLRYKRRGLLYSIFHQNEENNKEFIKDVEKSMQIIDKVK